MKIYIVLGHDPYDPFTWVEKIGYLNEEDAKKEAYALEQAFKEADGYTYYYVVKEIEVL